MNFNLKNPFLAGRQKCFVETNLADPTLVGTRYTISGAAYLRKWSRPHHTCDKILIWENHLKCSGARQNPKSSGTGEKPNKLPITQELPHAYLSMLSNQIKLLHLTQNHVANPKSKLPPSQQMLNLLFSVVSRKNKSLPWERDWSKQKQWRRIWAQITEHFIISRRVVEAGILRLGHHLLWFA